MTIKRLTDSDWGPTAALPCLFWCAAFDIEWDEAVKPLVRDSYGLLNLDSFSCDGDEWKCAIEVNGRSYSVEVAEDLAGDAWSVGVALLKVLNRALADSGQTVVYFQRWVDEGDIILFYLGTPEAFRKLGRAGLITGRTL